MTSSTRANMERTLERIAELVAGPAAH
jgi:hypothetical protein